MASINPTQDYDAIHTLTFASASGTCYISLFRGSSIDDTGTVYYRAGTSGAWTSLSVSGNSTTFNVTSTTMQIAHDWNKSGDNYMTPSFYGQSTNLVGISISQKAVLSGTVGTYFMYSYAYGCSSLTSLSVPDTSGVTSVGASFMRNYANGCTSLISLILPAAGLFATHDTNWYVPSGRLGYLKGYANNVTDRDNWRALTTSTSPNTLYLNYIRSADDVNTFTSPTVTTQAASSVTYNSATGNGNITATGGAAVTRRGFCYKTGTSGDPTTSDSVVYDDSTFGTGAYTKDITGLSASTGYRVRAYAINSVGTSYGTTVQVTTQSATAPIVSSVEASKIYKTSAIIGGNVSASDTTVSERGIYWGTTEGTQATKVASTSGTGTFSIHLTGLDEDTTYYFKAFGTNIGGTGYGDILHFKTAKFHSSVGDRDSLPSFELS